MAHESVLKKEKVYDLGDGLSLWKAHLDSLREQDVNARVMSPQKFERLVENIRKEQTLESLPLCVPQTNDAGNDELAIISGHHRTRAARAAGLTEVHVLVVDRELTRDEVISKQLSHNALEGEDDPEVKARLFAEIKTIEAKLASGVFEEDLLRQIPTVPIDDVQLPVQHELVVLMFLPRQYERFLDVLALIGRDEQVMLADYADFDRFKEAATQIAKRDNVRNVAAIVSRIVDLVLAHEKDDGEHDPD